MFTKRLSERFGTLSGHRTVDGEPDHRNHDGGGSCEQPRNAPYATLTERRGDAILDGGVSILSGINASP